MIRHRRRTISAENDDLVTQITSSTSTINTSPTLNENKDILLNIKQRNFWPEELSTKITNKTITIPLSEYVTRLHLTDNYYNKTQINNFIENFGVKIVVLQSKSELPTQGNPKYANSSYIFFVKHTHMAGSNNDRDIYDEYIWDDETKQYERIGNTDIDLTPYMTNDAFDSWISDTYNPFKTSINTQITQLKNTKADITYVDNKIIEDEIALIDAITAELNEAMITIDSNNINTFLELVDELHDNIDDSIAEHNVADTSHIDIRDIIDDSIDELDIEIDGETEALLRLLTEKINEL